jgi:hypothetical protein
MHARSNSWSESIYLAQKYKQIDLVVDFLKQRVESILHFFSEWNKNMDQQYNRLMILRDLKSKQLEDWAEARGDIDLGQSETMSTASTVASNTSRMSSVSAASSRRRKVSMRYMHLKFQFLDSKEKDRY